MKGVLSIGVIGAGQMGAGIAQVSALSGYKTQLWDINQDALQKGIKGIYGHLGKMAEKEKISQAQAEAAKGLLTGNPSISDLSNCDLVIEAATENFDIKLSDFYF